MLMVGNLKMGVLLTLIITCHVYQVPGSVVISARSGSHSFDPSQINVSHYVTQFSFGKRLSPRMLHEFIRLTPYLRGYHDRLAGQSYTVKHGEVNANVTVSP